MAIFYKPGSGKKHGATKHSKHSKRNTVSGEKKHIVSARSSSTSPHPQHTRLTINDIDWMGQGVVRGEPMYFVADALPGETVQIDVLSQKKHVVTGQARTIENTSAHRQQPFCQVAHQCGGCQLQHIKPKEARTLRNQALKSMLQRKLKFTDDIWQEPIHGNSTSYRRKARLAIDARNPNNVKIGFREQAGKKIVDIECCPVLVSELSQLIVPLKACVSSFSGAKFIGHISLLAGDNVVQVTIKHTRSLANDFIQSLREFAAAHKINLSLEDANGCITSLHQVEPIRCYTYGDFYLQPGPNDFVQVNGEVNRDMIAQALLWMSPQEGENIADCFSGLGNFTLPLAQSGAYVRAIEGVSEMVQRAKSNALEQGITHVDWLTLDLADDEAVAKALDGKFDKVLLDPSREGALTVCHALVKAKVNTLVYVSCNPNTFCRDARVLIDGGYQMKKAGIVEMFPFTHHMEMMALFTRPKK